MWDLIIGIMAFLEQTVFIDFALLQDTSRIICVTIIQGTTGFIILMTAYYFMQKSRKYLKKKVLWNKIIRGTMISFGILFLLAEAFCLSEIYIRKATISTFCWGYSEVLMQFNCSFSVILFGSLTLMTRYRITADLGNNPNMIH